MATLKRRFKIIENLADQGGAPLALVDDTNEIVRLGDRPGFLSEIAFESLGADEVEHEYLVTKREDRP